MRLKYREVLVVAALMLIAKSGYALQRGIPVIEGVYPSVVRLIIADGIYTSEHCTGTIIEGKYILTAAHCFDAFRKEGNKQIYYQRKVGMYSAPGISDLKTNCKQCFKPFNDVKIHPLYQYRDIAHDIAIIPLPDVQAGSDDFFFVASTRETKFSGHLVAFGRSSTDELGDWMKRHGNVKVTLTQDGTLVSVGDTNPFREFKGKRRQSAVPVATTPGNSGTALTIEGSGKIVGVVSAGYCFDLEVMEPRTELFAPRNHDCPYVFQAALTYYADLTRAENQEFVKNILAAR